MRVYGGGSTGGRVGLCPRVRHLWTFGHGCPHPPPIHVSKERVEAQSSGVLPGLILPGTPGTGGLTGRPSGGTGWGPVPSQHDGDTVGGGGAGQGSWRPCASPSAWGAQLQGEAQGLGSDSWLQSPLPLSDQPGASLLRVSGPRVAGSLVPCPGITGLPSGETQ